MLTNSAQYNIEYNLKFFFTYYQAMSALLLHLLVNSWQSVFEIRTLCPRGSPFGALLVPLTHDTALLTLLLILRKLLEEHSPLLLCLLLMTLQAVRSQKCF